MPSSASEFLWKKFTGRGAWGELQVYHIFQIFCNSTNCGAGLYFTSTAFDSIKKIMSISEIKSFSKLEFNFKNRTIKFSKRT